MGDITGLGVGLDACACLFALVLVARRLFVRLADPSARAFDGACAAVVVLGACDVWWRLGPEAQRPVALAALSCACAAHVACYACFAWRTHALFGSPRALALVPVALLACQLIVPAFPMLAFGSTCALLLTAMGAQARHERVLAQRFAELEQVRADMVLSQIQPHFLYNTLAAVRQLCRVDAPRAGVVLDDFCAYLRGNMASLSEREAIPFADELEHTRTYLELEGIRLGERLRVRYDVGPTGFRLPALTVQTLAENAVRHGVSRRPEGGCVRISTSADERGFYVLIEDDGVGFDPARPPEPSEGERDREHLGIANARLRLERMCGGTLEVASEPGRGTRARVSVPRPRALHAAGLAPRARAGEG